MTERHANAGPDEPRDEACRHHFRRQGHEQYSVARRSQQREIVRTRLADLPRVMHARLVGRQIRPFEVDPSIPGSCVATALVASNASLVFSGLSVTSVGSRPVVRTADAPPRWCECLARSAGH